MRNFYFSEDDYEEIEHEEFEIDPEIMEWVKIDFVSMDISHRLLKTTIKMLEKSFWWRFRSHKTKLKMIEETYQVLERILNPEEEE